ncbi:uncharacterized protein LOC126738920 [Anthonomus grandis grandis]|uniref:uncharacterized protein LOC126738920 n=1 Tax=Anthonomus grandis grandis TaxID=2921223 RepID=UPI002164F858|nr:uncharacterized protein LOC126738920 [Anthonomus grandis grandis]
MRPRYYVHMGPRSAEKVSRFWKDSHLLLFALILAGSAIGAACVYNILDMYKFHCILYAHTVFETSFEDRIKTTTELVTSTSLNSSTSNSTSNITTKINSVMLMAENAGHVPWKINNPDVKAESSTKLDNFDKINKEVRIRRRLRRFEALGNTSLVIGSKAINVKTTDNFLHKVLKKLAKADFDKDSFRNYLTKVNTTGFLNMRKTIFATVYMCNLILFTPLTSAIMAVFLGALIMVGGKGGAGNPGDLLPNPWICVYPFLGICSFMMVFCFVSNTIFQNGFGAFCSEYYNLTKVKTCSDRMNRYNVQFSEKALGPPQNFYLMYIMGSYALIAISILWLMQTLVYVMRIIWLADFTIYLTTVKLAADDKAQDGKMAGLVMQLLDTKAKTK